ncbi:MAG: SMP-30/gluconolactonase/LRE family protein [Gemmatimonadaceae bacterium]|nr:SMP-30/gluconolactonase/LRE family protein [Gemmatimonadaceae bacterium]
MQMMAGGNQGRALAAAMVLAAAACGRDKEASNAATKGPVVDSTAPGRASTTNGFKTPESVRYDSANDVFYVSNINGSPTDNRKNNGFISRMKPDGTIDSLMLLAGGRDGVTLNSPKGLALIGDTLWVADIDAVRAFNVRTGATVATVDFSPFHALFLNDICVGGDGALYITDSGLQGDAMTHVAGSDRIFRIDAAHKATIALATDSLHSPNGITWDKTGNRFIIVANDKLPQILAWRPGTAQPFTIGYGSGENDGVEILADRRLIVTSWADSTVSIRDGSVRSAIRNLPSPADIGIDTRRMHIAVPLLEKDRVEIITIPARKEAP